VFNKFFTTINCLNQAIQPKVVGPLFYLGGVAYIVTKFIGIGCGTSIRYKLFMCVGALAPTQRELV
jgi:putative flippase GtrA